MRMLLLSVLLAGACTPAEESPWLLEEANLGADVAASSGFTLSSGDDAWLAAAQLLPGQVWSDPGYELPLSIWAEIVDDQSIADEGSCPYVVADGPTLSWVSNCRSQDGYDWSGTVSRTDGEEDGRTTQLWELDLEIIADTDFPRFSRVMMSGAVWIVEGEDALREGVQTNLITAVEDFESVAQGDEEQKAIWSAGWALSSRQEEHTNGTLLMEGATELGSQGGITFSGTALAVDPLCPSEPDGTLTLTSGSVAGLTLDGVSGMCDSCAELTLDGVSMGEVCRY